MPNRNSNNKKESTPSAVPLRRSPRFLQIVVVNPEDPKTPNPEQGRRSRVPSSPLTLTGKRPVSARKRRSHKSQAKECDDSGNAKRVSGDSKSRSKKSTKLPHRRNNKHFVTLGQWITEEDVKVKPLKNKVKHITRSQDNICDQYDKLEVDDNTNEGVLLITEKEHLDEELSEKDVNKRKNEVDVSTAVVVHQGTVNVNNRTPKIVGVKRTRNQFENIAGTAHGWTNDQESALERAYLEAKPTPHFWKKVSRLVPGKSAQECFDKIHGSHLTPPQPRLRSKPRVSNLQNPSFSASKLINSSSPKTKKPRFRKQKIHVVQRTVRHMLQNQYKVEQDSEADLFSILEPTFSPSVNCNLMLTTPDRNPDEVNTRFQDRSSAAHKKSVSRFSRSYGKTLVSPPVLKQVKNKVLHEKYIDQLNCREANRKAAFAKAEKVNQRKATKRDNSVERKDAIKAAKNALVFGARDAINEFQYQQATVLNNLFDEECGVDAYEDNGLVFF